MRYFVLVLLIACSKPAPSAPEQTKTDLPPPFDMRLRAGLMFTYLDGEGVQHSTEKLEEIPEDKRGAVRVIDLTMAPEARGAGKWIFLADLRKANDDGTYPYQPLPAAKFDKAVAHAPIRHKVDQAMENSTKQVTVYSTTWCGVCSKAKAYLRERKVPFVERDVEKDESALAELGEKARRAKVQPQGVPVIDVYGELMLGFDEARLSQLLEKHPAGVKL